MAETPGKVFLVGAGPGAPDLISLRGARLLGRADVVVYDSLVSPELLRLAPASADLIYVGKRGGDAKAFDQATINQLLIDQARAGRKVVRLKGGDPFIFGRGGEEAQALAEAGIEFEIVPGITSAIAAPAFAGIPLTHRDHGSFVTFVTGHEEPMRDPAEAVPWDELARAANRRGTIVILMAAARIRATLAQLIVAGLPAETPAAMVQWGTTAAQHTVTATLATLADTAAAQGLASPAVVVVGECVRLRDQLAWCEKLPLFGRRIVVTRAGDQAADFAARLRDCGAEVIEFPTIAFGQPSSHATLDRAIAEAAGFDWIIFTSARGVDAFIDRLRILGRDLRATGTSAIAAIGPATADRLGQHALIVAAMPTAYRAEAIIDAIGPSRIAGARILIPRAEVAREVLPELLVRQGAREVVVAPTYRTILPTDGDVDRIRALAAAKMIDLVTCTSSSTVTNFHAIVGDPALQIPVAAIGPITAETARANGFTVIVTAEAYTTADLAAAIVAHFLQADLSPAAPPRL
jgi:uroporphyrinogen III methyltransferase/synthase